MKRKNIIRLTESELKTLISESVKNILKESGVRKNNKSSDISKNFDVDLYDVEFSNPELDEYLSELENLPETVEVVLHFREVPYDKGDYYTPPSGGYAELEDYDIDSDGTFEKLLPPELYQHFIEDVSNYIDENASDFESEAFEEYDEPEYDYWEAYKDRKLGL